jgi:hypothetical protein
MGQVLYEDGKYLVEYEGQRHVMKAGDMVDPEALKKAVGLAAELVVVEIIVAVRIPRLPCVLCYVPADPWVLFERVGPEVRKGMLRGFLDEGLITPEIFEQQIAGM